MPSVIEAVEKHFAPVEAVLKKVSNLQSLDGPIINVLRKTYQSNWKSIHAQCLPAHANEGVMQKVQTVLSIGDEQKPVNMQIVDFVRKIGEVAF